MVEYISREAVLKCIENDGYEGEYDLGYYAHNREFQELIEEIPAADVKPIIRAYNKHGVGSAMFECSACGWECIDTVPGDTETYNFCPNCGAEIREVEK